MPWQVVLTGDGSYTLAHPVHGQTCHSRAGAWQESRERYAQACRLTARARAMAESARIHGGHPVFRLLDVGTGLGLNIAAALEALSETGVALDVVSLESDTSVISATLELFEGPDGNARRALPQDVERWHAPVRRALTAALGAEPNSRAPTWVPMSNGSLRLLIGDGRSTLPNLADDSQFDAVFLDPFSPGVEPALWDFSFLAEIARRMSREAWLSTYTVSLTVRSMLVATGLNVGPGGRVGTKASGTVATRDAPVEKFDARTARRLELRAAARRADFSDRIPGRASVSDQALI